MKDLHMLLRGSLLGLAVIILPSAWTSPRACRCAELPIEHHFENAGIVLVGRADVVNRIESSDVAPRLEVRFTPLFRQGRAFKGSIDGVVFVTPIGSASCGVDVQHGETYIIFASTGDPEAPNRAWFDTCSGSRRYASGPNASEQQPFVGLPNNRIVPRLFELADSTLTALQPLVPEFHTSPACWQEARIVHQGAPSSELRQSVRVEWTADVAPDTGGVSSPNGAYRFWAHYQAGSEPGRGDGSVLVDVEHRLRLSITSTDVRAMPQPAWINEKLLFVRLIWGRIQFTDLIVDVERGIVIYEEAARYAADAFQQFQEACRGQCPCLVVPGSAHELPAPPVPRPRDGETGVLDGLARSLAFLNERWDGRVFTDAGGRVYTMSALKGALGREEYPVDVVEVRQVDGGWWLRVELYRISTCTDPAATPVHAGWVPAFSEHGELVAGTYPAGCAP